jgi:hypothetical protein
MTGNAAIAAKFNTSPRLLSAEAAKKLKTALDALAESASPVDPSVTDEITLIAHGDEEWFCLNAFYAQRVVGDALKERGFPTTSTSNCIISEKYPQYVRADLFNDNIQSLIMAAGKFGQKDSDDLVKVIMGFNRIELVWPESGEGELDFTTFYVLMSAQKGKLVLDRRLGCAVRFDSMRITQMQSGTVITFASNVKMAYGLEVATFNAHVTEPVFDKTTLNKLRYVPLSDDVLAGLIASGKEISARLQQSETMHGQLRGVGFVPGMMGKRVSVSVSGRVIHDPCGCHELMPDDFNGLLRLYDLYADDEGDVPTSAIIDDLTYAQIMPYGILYDLGMSRWFIASVNDLKPVDFRADAFDQLVLDPQKKSMIRAIVKNREVVNSGAISGKGAGSIFLLAGEPGCGKTLTAEAVAESIHAPLFKVNFGSLSSDIEKLEKRLAEVLQLSSRWGSVLLIDEADAYMEARDSNDLHRNALVAVFLRLLEYYTGVLFLTSNRGRNVDTAFWSRITMALHYPALDRSALTTIWGNMLRNAAINLCAEDVQSLLEFGANGREIGNAINAAQSLALDEKVPVNASHLRSILSIKQQFMLALSVS